MISDSQLISLGKRGFIPGPNETEKIFLERVEFFEKNDCKLFSEISPFSLHDKIPIHDWSWARAKLQQVFDVSPDWISAYYSNHKLLPWQGGMAWIIEAPFKPICTIIQIRKKSLFVSRDELLAHEGAHAIRAAFEEPLFEEFFAYLLSDNPIRRIFGPMIYKTKETLFFLFFLLLGFWGNLFLGPSPFFQGAKLFTGILFLIGIFRLTKRRKCLLKAYRNLNELFNNQKSSFSVLFRLTDEEISFFSKAESKDIYEYALLQKMQNLRWRQIFLSYFEEIVKKIRT